MSLFANIDHLAAAKGIIALLVETPEHAREFRGLGRWQPILTSSMMLLSMSGLLSIRLVIDHHTLILQKENDQVIGVVIPTGHAIAKSLRRMIRRLAKRPRNLSSRSKNSSSGVDGERNRFSRNSGISAVQPSSHILR